MFKQLISLMLFVAIAGKIIAQEPSVDDLLNETKPKKEPVAYTFKATRIISGHSIETVKKNALDFRISHRFGDIATSQAAHTLGGFYAVEDVMFSFEYGILSDLTVGVMGTKGAGPVKELYSGFIKYKALKQTTDFKIPLTITLFGNASVSGMANDPYGTGILMKNQKAAHRFSYTLQALLAVKATRWLSLQLSPTFVWRNYVAANDKNATFYLGLSGRAKFTKRASFVFEYFLPLQKSGATYREYFPMLRGMKSASYYPVLNFGFEFETGGHVFDVNITNSGGLVENDFLPYTNKNWAQGQFRLGFTISRMFQFGKGVNPWTGRRVRGKKV